MWLCDYCLIHPQLKAIWINTVSDLKYLINNGQVLLINEDIEDINIIAYDGVTNANWESFWQHSNR